MKHRRALASAAYLRLALVAAALAAAPWPGEAVAGEDVFVAGIGDLPLMSGLSEVAGAGIVFDTPAGRIVEAYAEGALERTAVARFYAATLPQLGWRARGDNIYVREGERLGLVFLGGDGDLIVRFTLEPD